MSGSSARIVRAARSPSSVWSGGMRMSMIATSGLCARTLRSSLGVAGLPDDLDARPSSRRGERPRAAAPSPRRSRRARDLRAAARSRRRPGWRRRAVPSSAARRSASPRRPEPRGRVGAAAAVVADLDGQRAVAAPDVAPRLGAALRVAGGVGQRLGDEEVGGRLDRAAGALVGDGDRAATGHGERADERLAAPASSPPSVSTAGWMPRASSRSSADRAAEVLDRLVEQLARPRPGSRRARPRAMRRSSASSTSRCCAPSWRSRSSRRRAASAAATMRARERAQLRARRARSVMSRR